MNTKTQQISPIRTSSSDKISTFDIFKSLWEFLCFVILVFVSSSTLAQQSSLPESLDLRLATLEQSYDSQVIGILSNYFDRRKFFVDIDIDAEVVDETYRTTQNQIVRQPNSNQEVIMPGLPFLPEENRQPGAMGSSESTQTVINESTVQRLQILQLRIDIYADSSFTQQEIEFMRLIAGIAGKINEARGDIVNVSQLAMPDFGFDSTPTSNNASMQPQSETLLGSLKDYVPGFVLLLLIGLTLLIGRLTNKPTQPKPSLKERRDDFKDDELERNRTSREELKQNEENQARQEETDEESSEDSDLDYITEQFFNNSKEVALLFEFWLQEYPDSGAFKSAQVVNCIDKHLLKSLKGDLDNKNYLLIEREVESMSPLSLREKTEIAANFKKALKNNDGNVSAGRNKKHKQLGLFQFLDHLKTYQIEQLLIGEDQTTAALIIDYLPEDRESDVLNNLDENRTTQIMLGMTDLHTLSYQDHKEISSRLFSKAMDILEIEKELQQGSENILRVLEKLPLNEQSRYIEQLKATGSPIAERIDKQFITIDEIPQLDTATLKSALDPLPTEVILDAIMGLEKEIIEKILSTRPKREQRLLRMELQQSDYGDNDQSNEAKSKLMRAIRKGFNTSN